MQEERPIKTPEVEEFSDDLYGDEHNELLVSTVTVGPNITDYEVCGLCFRAFPNIASMFVVITAVGMCSAFIDFGVWV